ncbi:cytochrome P450 302a1, mitochondrial isoform X2 [Bacillus rossius redtenbacheri]|uniref:cytochrome P450 302a1, mitochondrial isoform X2 n=1 Tax=Bacillus rossius redtenbacheri TaxID=93214 RepID=UPI002FDE509F
MLSMYIMRMDKFSNFRITCIRFNTCIRLESTSVKPKNFCDIPGPRSLPLVGTLWKYAPMIGEYEFTRLHWNGLRKYQKYGQIVREEIVPGVPIVWVFSPEDIGRVFKAEGRYPERRSHLALAKCRQDKPEVFNTGGLLPTNGPEWWRLRSAFQREISKVQCVRGYLPTTNTVISEFLEELKSNESSNKTAGDVLPKLSRLFLELIGVVAFDIRLESFSESEKSPMSKSSKLIEAAHSINSSILSTDNGLQMWKWFDTPLFRKLKKAHSYMEQIAVQLVLQKMELMKECANKCSPEHHPSLLEAYLSSPDIDYKDVIGMAVDMILAGIDTTSNSVSFALYHLAKNPHAQMKLHEESCKLLSRVDCLVTAEMLSEAQYTKAVIKESFRLNPISVGIGRILAQDAVLSGYNVPKGNQVSCRLARYFESPHDFLPERWLKGEEAHKPASPYLVLPFGHGPRTCIARRLAEQNMQVLLLKVARRYKIGWEGGMLDAVSLLINKPDQPVLLTFQDRH